MKFSIPSSDLSELSERLSGLSSRLNRFLESKMQVQLAPGSEFRFNLGKFKDFTEIRALALLSWYVGESGFLLREQIRERNLRGLSFSQQVEIELYLRGRDITENLILTKFNRRSWRTSHFPKIEEVSEKLKLYVQKPPYPEKGQRPRGYLDKGTLKPETRWQERFDHSFNEEQRKIEQRRDFFTESLQSIQNKLELGIYSDYLEKVSQMQKEFEDLLF